MPPTGSDPSDTRAAVVEAAVEVLVESGAADFTTPKVAHRAGVAQGTVYVHFATKRDLLVATVESAIEQVLSETVTVLIDRMSSEAPRDPAALVRLVIEVLWAGYIDDRVQAAYEVRAMCRTDSSLAKLLTPVLERLDTDGGDLVGFLVPDSMRIPGANYTPLARLVSAALQGRAMTRRSLPDPSHDEDLIDSIVAAVLDRIEHLNPSPQANRTMT